VSNDNVATGPPVNLLRFAPLCKFQGVAFSVVKQAERREKKSKSTKTVVA
jgi:hypothetical protein